jgi:hypothetical protein
MTIEDPETRRKVDSLEMGRIRAVGSLTLTANGTATFTIVTHPGCSTTSNPVPIPRDAGAATATFHVVPGNGQFTIYHAASTTTRTFGYSIHSRSVP